MKVKMILPALTEATRIDGRRRRGKREQVRLDGLTKRGAQERER